MALAWSHGLQHGTSVARLHLLYVPFIIKKQWPHLVTPPYHNSFRPEFSIILFGVYMLLLACLQLICCYSRGLIFTPHFGIAVECLHVARKLSHKFGCSNLNFLVGVEFSVVVLCVRIAQRRTYV